MKAFARTSAWIWGLDGWRRLVFAFVCGAVSASAFAPLEFFPALLIGYAVLVGLMDGACAGPKPIRCAAAIGWAFCFGQFLAGWHWIGYAFLIDPSSHLWQMPFALLGLTAGLALYGALALAISAYFWRPGPARILIFAVAMASAEWLRGHLFTGFPWNLSAYGWGASLALLQSAALMGSYGLSFLTILLGASLWEPFCRRWRIPLQMALLFFALWSYGVYRLGTTPRRDVAGVSLRLVQPDIPQAEKIRPLPDVA
jgi:apolipoprotein N-acyltransferase